MYTGFSATTWFILSKWAAQWAAWWKHGYGCFTFLVAGGKNSKDNVSKRRKGADAKEDATKGLTGKKLEQALKKEAAKAARDEAAATRKAEAERKKVAKQTTKKTLQLSTRFCQPLTNAFTTAYDVFNKARWAAASMRSKQVWYTEQFAIGCGCWTKMCEMHRLSNVESFPKAEGSPWHCKWSLPRHFRSTQCFWWFQTKNLQRHLQGFEQRRTLSGSQTMETNFRKCFSRCLLPGGVA